MAKANHTINIGNNSLATINELALAIEMLAESVPDEQLPTRPTFVVEGILAGIQHLAKRINQLTQASLAVKLVQGGEKI